MQKQKLYFQMYCGQSLKRAGATQHFPPNFQFQRKYINASIKAANRKTLLLIQEKCVNSIFYDSFFIAATNISIQHINLPKDRKQAYTQEVSCMGGK